MVLILVRISVQHNLKSNNKNNILTKLLDSESYIQVPLYTGNSTDQSRAFQRILICLQHSIYVIFITLLLK